MSRKELKQAAKDQLRGHWGWAVCLSLFAYVIIYVAEDIVSLIFDKREIVYTRIDEMANGVVYHQSTTSSVINLIVSVLLGLIVWGVCYTLLQFRDKGDQPNIFKGMFSAYTDGKFTSSFITYLVELIFLILWTLLFIIPGIIKAFSYAMTPYIMKDLYDAGKTPTMTEAITKSRHLMNGHKTDLFVLWLSFIGWAILSVITLGIGFIWLVPYYRQTMVNFYRDLAGDQFLKEN